MYEPGTVLAGKYRVERRLGRGGMGVVLAAEHIDLRTTVAVKCLHEAFAGRDDVVKRFLREARAAAQLQSDHVCRVFDVGRLDGGVPYIVMELLAGRDLAKVLRAGTLDVAIAINYVQQACDAIAEAHAARIIHRDLKPGNLFLTQRRDGAPLIKVLDFGVAKAPEEGDWTLTHADAIIGSPAYMAPEQIRASRTADERSDIWSLGVILYELVSGVQPFQGAALADLAIRIVTEPFEPLRGVPPGFAAVVGRCLEKDPAQRFSQVGELAAALAAIELVPQPHELPTQAMPPVRPSSVPPSPAPVPASPVPAMPAPSAAMSSRELAAAPRMPLPNPPSAPVPVMSPPRFASYGSETDTPVSTTLRSASGAMASARTSRAPRRIIVIGGVAAALIAVGLGVLFGPLSGRTDEAPVHPGAHVEMPRPTAPPIGASATGPAAAAPSAASSSATTPRPPAATAPAAASAPAAAPASVPASAAEVVEPTAPVPAATIDAGVAPAVAPSAAPAPAVAPATAPAPADDGHHRTPPHRPTKPKSKEQIGESRI